MFSGRFQSSVRPIGVDIGTAGVRLLQLREPGRQLEVVDAVSFCPAEITASDTSPSGHDETNPLVDEFRRALSRGSFAGRQCVAALPREDVFIQTVRLPSMPDDDLRQAVAWEAAERFGLERDNLQVDFIRTGAARQSNENREEIVVVAVTQTSISRWIEPMLSAGLKPIAIDTHFGSLGRIFSRTCRREADRNIVRAVLEIGRNGSMVLILRGDEIAFAKPIKISGVSFDEAVSHRLQIELDSAAELRASRISATANPDRLPPVDAPTDRAVFQAVRPLFEELDRELTLCMRYYGVTFRGTPPDRIILSGGESLEPRLAESLAESCKIQVVRDDQEQTLESLRRPIRETHEGESGPVECWATAAGLSLRGVGCEQPNRRTQPTQCQFQSQNQNQIRNQTRKAPA